MAEKPWNGDLRRVPFPEILAALTRDHASGTLFCVRGATTRTVHLSEGRPYWASSSDPDESARAWLFRRGRIPVCPGFEGERPTQEFLQDPETRALIEQHALELVLDLFSWGDGAFIFQPVDIPPATLFRMDTPFETLLGLGLRRVRRLSLVRAGCGPLEARIEPTPDVAMDKVLGLEDDICLILGEISSGAMGDLSIDNWPCDYRVMQCVWQLRILGYIRPAEDPMGVEIRRLLRGSHRFNDGTDEYARPDEFTAPRLNHEPRASAAPAAPPGLPAGAPPPAPPPSTPSRTPPVAVRRDPPPQAIPPPARPAQTTVLPRPQAPAVLKRSRPETGGEATPAEDTPSINWSETPRARVSDLNSGELQQASSPAVNVQAMAVEWFRNGERFVRELDFHNAITSYREAVNLEPDNPEYRLKLGALLAKNPKWRKEAEEHLQRAAALKPWEARFQVALGKMYADAGLEKKAESAFKAAMEADPAGGAGRKELQRLKTKVEEGDKGGGLLDRLSRIGKGEKGASGADKAAKERDLEEAEVG